LCLIGGGFDLLVFTSGDLPEALQAVVTAAQQQGLPLRVTAVGVTRPVAGADQHLPDADGRVRARYGLCADHAAQSGAYLLRPDQHICARWLRLDAPRLQAALATALPH